MSAPSHESAYVCNRIAETAGLPEVVRSIVAPISRAANCAANGIDDANQRRQVLESLLEARDEAVCLLTAFVRAAEHREAMLADLELHLATMKAEMNTNTADVLNKMKEAERAVRQVVTAAMKVSMHGEDRAGALSR
jgi:hypothetical protein